VSVAQTNSYDYLETLATVNPWARPHAARQADWGAGLLSPGFEEARRTASLERLAQGVDAWNDWAFAMLRIAHDAREDADLSAIVRAFATADLSGTVLDGMTDLGGYQFPWDAVFTHARFRRDIWLIDTKFGGRADFRSVDFDGKAWMEHATFRKAADFSGALFAKTVELRHSRFLGGASFAGARFHDAWFRGARWAGDVTFAGASFSGEAGLGDCRFEGTVDLSNVAFDDNAGFEGATFEGPVTLAGTRFGRRARFARVRFAVPPVLERARFARPPDPAGSLPPPSGSPVHDHLDRIRRRLGVR